VAQESERVHVVSPENRWVGLNTIVTAFAADPLLRWILPSADNYLIHSAAVFDKFGGIAFDAGTAYQIGDFAGVALWVPPSHAQHTDDEDSEFSELLAQLIAPDRLEEVSSVLAQMQGYHPQDDCWYLPLIGVDPGHQGRGFGAQLMKHALACCDEAGLPAYLESSNPVNISLYQRFGFEVMGRIETNTSPPVHPMLRPRQ
jgi:ribosomal protein S18 acetylase RimI-like enzyme